MREVWGGGKEHHEGYGISDNITLGDAGIKNTCSELG